MVTSLSIVIILSLVIFIGHKLRADGANKEKNKQYEKILEDVNKANTARRDAAKRSRVRRKYTRK